LDNSNIAKVVPPEINSDLDCAETATRKLAVVLYQNKSSSQPCKICSETWSNFKERIKLREIRDQKDGIGFSPVALTKGKSRANSNVLHIDMAVVDIDSKLEKDSAGNILNVTWTAPDLPEIEHRFSEYEFIAHSSYGNDPELGIIKYRLIFPLSRQVSPAEWGRVWDGLNILIGGSIDDSTKDISRFYYLPACPGRLREYSWWSENDGGWLNPDDLIALSDQSKRIPNRKTAVTIATSATETPVNVARLRSALEYIPPSSAYPEWRNAVWAIASTGWDCAEDLARSWSMSDPAYSSGEGFDKVWQSFDPTRGITLGTFFHIARQAGWPGESSANSVNQDDDPTSGDIKNGKEFALSFRDHLLFVHETNESVENEP